MCLWGVDGRQDGGVGMWMYYILGLASTMQIMPKLIIQDKYMHCLGSFCTSGEHILVLLTGEGACWSLRVYDSTVEIVARIRHKAIGQ